MKLPYFLVEVYINLNNSAKMDAEIGNFEITDGRYQEEHPCGRSVDETPLVDHDHLHEYGYLHNL